MFEEDRQTAIAMYEKMFEMAPDEDALISYLSSPTRQAVLIARSYDAKERKLSIHSEDGNESASVHGDEPAQFIETIKEIFSDALDAIPETEENNENSAKVTPKEEKEISWVKEESPIEVKRTENADSYQKTVSTDSPSMDYVDEFIKGLSIDINELDDKNETAAENNNKETETEEEKLIETAITRNLDVEMKEPENVKDDSKPDSTDEQDLLRIQSDMKSEEDAQNQKLSGGALVIFLLIAIPLTALGLILIFGIAIVVLALAAAALIMAFRTFQAAFGSFKVFADLLVVAGSGLCISAVGILLLWTFIYLIVGVTSKMINGVINLCIKICSKKEAPNK